ncbi:hypothetical protein [Nonomuraea indica]|uniref:Hemerythrin-like domain-containing protein n=1 Tax=Nonomuraea indica TaxID=1581193 RepID=A0ABW8A246_9ACTN
MNDANGTGGASVARRHPGDPYPDLTSARIVHRAWREDLTRLADLATTLASAAPRSDTTPYAMPSGTTPYDTTPHDATPSGTTRSGTAQSDVPPSESTPSGTAQFGATRSADDVMRTADGDAVVSRRRAAAIRDYVTVLCHELIRQGRGEARIVWPLVDASAGGAIDMDPYRDERRRLAPLVENLCTTAADFARTPSAHVAGLAVALREMRDALDEHFGYLEQDIRPMIHNYVTLDAYEAAERRMWRSLGLTRLARVLPWLARVATPEERRHLKRRTGLVGWIILTVLGPVYANLERRVFGDPTPGNVSG